MKALLHCHGGPTPLRTKRALLRSITPEERVGHHGPSPYYPMTSSPGPLSQPNSQPKRWQELVISGVKHCRLGFLSSVEWASVNSNITTAELGSFSLPLPYTHHQRLQRENVHENDHNVYVSDEACWIFMEQNSINLYLHVLVWNSWFKLSL